jgi:soluble lytic murein transglycosylase-like protein
MKLTTPKLLAMFMITLCFCAITARAQLASYVDPNGKLVFINADPPAPPRTAIKARKSSSAAAQKLPGNPPSSEASSQASSALPAPSPGSGTGPGTKSNPVPVVMAPAALDAVVQQSAEKNHVDPALVRAVISTESNWNSSAVSPKGALGLMQLIPGTAERLGVGNAFDPVQNVDAGTRYLGTLLQRYNGDLSKALAAYNAGPGAVDRFGGIPNYPETRNYVEKVTSTYFSPGSGRQPHAFAIPRPIYRALDANGRLVFSNE